MKQGPKFQPEKSTEEKELVISRPEIQEFIKTNKINPADFPTIEKLAGFPKNTIIMRLHNVFILDAKNSIANIERWITKEAPDEESKELYETILIFAKKYGPDISHTLVRVLEDL